MVPLVFKTRGRNFRLLKEDGSLEISSRFCGFLVSLTSLLISSHFADNHLSRLILGENWQQGGYMETARETRIRAAD